MITLSIRKANGDLYWTEYFNTKVDCDKWLAEEQTRPYWDINFQVTIDDKTVIEEAKNKKAKEDLAARQVKQEQLLLYFRNLKRQDITPADMPDIMMNVRKYILGEY